MMLFIIITVVNPRNLWTSNDDGDQVDFCQYYNETEEAEGIVTDIMACVAEHKAEYKDCAVLYRTNAQSRSLEERCVIKGIPYRIVRRPELLSA